jgi:hypothetical protein
MLVLREGCEEVTCRRIAVGAMDQVFIMGCDQKDIWEAFGLVALIDSSAMTFIDDEMRFHEMLGSDLVDVLDHTNRRVQCQEQRLNRHQ